MERNMRTAGIAKASEKHWSSPKHWTSPVHMTEQETIIDYMLYNHVEYMWKVNKATKFTSDNRYDDGGDSASRVDREIE